MDKPIRIPRNQTALMQHMQRQVSQGHFFWCADRIPREKLARFILKWSHYALRADAPARAYRKQCGRASVHLCLSPTPRPVEAAALDSGKAAAGAGDTATDAQPVAWWMLSTAGKAGLAEGMATPAAVFDSRTARGRLRYLDYELVQLAKVVKSGGKSKTVTTWTWRLTPERYLSWEALLIERAKQRDTQGLMQAVDCLRAMPMFSGIRSQVVKLIVEADKMLGKLGCAPLEVPNLPVMRMIALWDERAAI